MARVELQMKFEIFLKLKHKFKNLYGIQPWLWHSQNKQLGWTDLLWLAGDRQWAYLSGVEHIFLNSQVMSRYFMIDSYQILVNSMLEVYSELLGVVGKWKKKKSP